jgi:hypothetical protein
VTVYQGWEIQPKQMALVNNDLSSDNQGIHLLGGAENQRRGRIVERSGVG